MISRIIMIFMYYKNRTFHAMKNICYNKSIDMNGKSSVFPLLIHSKSVKTIQNASLKS